MSKIPDLPSHQESESLETPPSTKTAPQTKQTKSSTKKPTKKPAKKATKKTTKKTVKRAANYLPFAEARAYVRSQMIPSVRAYEVWWQQDRPDDIPRFPYRAYAVDWISWNDYLGNTNGFDPANKRGKTWRDFDDARAFVHQLGFQSSYEWMAYVRNAHQAENDEPSEQELMSSLIDGPEDEADQANSQTDNGSLPPLPPDIPKRPDISYASYWVSWNHWLGNNIYDRMNLHAEMVKSSIFYIIQDPTEPSNVFNFGVEIGGLRTMKEMYERKPYNLIKFFWHEPDKHEQIDRIVKHYSHPYLGDESSRVAPNVWYIIEELQEVLDVVLPKEIAGTR